MLDLPERPMPFRTMQVAVIPQGCLKYSCQLQMLRHSNPADRQPEHLKEDNPRPAEDLARIARSINGRPHKDPRIHDTIGTSHRASYAHRLKLPSFRCAALDMRYPPLCAAG